MLSPSVRALLSPFNLSVLLMAVFAGLVAAWWLFPLGLAFWSVMMWSATRNPAARITQAVQGRTPLAARFQRLFDRIERTQVGIFNAVAAADVPTALVRVTETAFTAEKPSPAST